MYTCINITNGTELTLPALKPPLNLIGHKLNSPASTLCLCSLCIYVLGESNLSVL